MSNSNDTVTTGVRVRMALTRERQSDVARVLGVSQVAVSNRLAGRVSWTLEDLDKLAGHWQVPVADLVSPPGMWLGGGVGEQRGSGSSIGTGRKRRRSVQRIGGSVVALPLPRTSFETVAA